MKLYLITGLLTILFYSCATSKKNRIDVCDDTTFSIDNTKNDTSIISYVDSGVFDTTLCNIYGIVIDNRTMLPLKHLTINISNGSSKLITKTNSKGEFEFSRSDLKDGKWELSIFPKKYNCLFVKEINQFQSSAGFIRCKIKLYIPK